MTTSRSRSSDVETTAPPPAPWPRRIRFLRLGPVSLKIDLLATAVTVVLVVATALIALWSLGISTTSSPNLGLGEIFRVLAGLQSGSAADRVVAAAPAVIVAVLGGISLALSGAIFQTVTRNPLGSPDIIGFTTGAYTGALVAMLVFGLGSAGTTVGALIGCLATGVAVYFLGMRGGTGNYRFIVVGIGISAMLVSFNGYLVATADVQNAGSAAAWGMGNLRDLTMSETVPVFVVLAILLPVLAVVTPRMRMFELGADSAQSKGVNTGRTELLLLVVGVGFAAATTSVAGPIAFVALVAPQLAARLTPSAGIPLVTSAAVGATLLVSSDAIARTVLAPTTQLPVGVVTTALGGVYLLFLLMAQARKARL
ncbi:iron chelate uptake ABC transporter family permease subunit [Gordonia sp. PP30]|uniref:FecCD family ABC transporter permease n=1 Tax=Gordonia sp. PP30 TaxID=2935861 RepID=UPI001FFFD344|nr:iron chelate uptake ABC transporter family permease subunit [Gordonia sp. PP30]UQE75190.1 iron chelate uptake ABC transporter family permease subunit [Gordonia sp. PP30]